MNINTTERPMDNHQNIFWDMSKIWKYFKNCMPMFLNLCKFCLPA